jgi:hypothetical protein
MPPGLRLQVEHQTALVAVASEEKRRHAWTTLRSKLAGRIAVGRLDLHDNCAQIAELLCRTRTQQDGRAIENSHSG